VAADCGCNIKQQQQHHQELFSFFGGSARTLDSSVDFLPRSGYKLESWVYLVMETF